MNLSVSRELQQSKFSREQSAVHMVYTVYAVCTVCSLRFSNTVVAWMRVKAVYAI